MFDGVTKVIREPHVLDAAELGYPMSSSVAIGALLLACGPRTQGRSSLELNDFALEGRFAPMLAFR